MMLVCVRFGGHGGYGMRAVDQVREQLNSISLRHSNFVIAEKIQASINQRQKKNNSISIF